MNRQRLSVRGVAPWQWKGRHGRRWWLCLRPLSQLRGADSSWRKWIPSYHRAGTGRCEQNIARDKMSTPQSLDTSSESILFFFFFLF